MSICNLKVVLLGEGCVGKTSCVLRYVEGTFSDKHVTTIQASFLKKTVTHRGKRVTLSIWDTAGQERFHALGPIYYRDANGAILVYDITDQDSFQKVKNWVRELRKMLGTDIELAIAGNKIDLEKERQVDVTMAEEYAKSVGARHFHTSAKMNRGIDDLFEDLTQHMMVSADDRSKNRPTSFPRNQLTIVSDNTCAPNQGDLLEGSKKSKCCGGGQGDDPEVT